MIGFSVRNLIVRLNGRTIVDRVSFDAAGGITMLLGRNGCGKSTLLRAMLGLLPSGGEILLNGRDFRTLSVRERARAVAYLPQRQSIPPATTALEYVALGGYPNQNPFASPDASARSRARAMLEEFGLSALSGRRMDALSGGEARMAALARARMQGSRYLLLDEPLAGLDFCRQHEFLDRLRQCRSPSLMSLHDPMLAWQYADRVLLMDGGRMVLCCGRTDEAAFARALQSIYGPQLFFESVGGRRLPVWHDVRKGI